MIRNTIALYSLSNTLTNPQAADKACFTLTQDVGSKRGDQMPCPTREHGSYGPSQGRCSKKTREPYEEVKSLGEGAQGKVCVVRRRSNKKLLIRKEQNAYSIFDDMPCETHILKEVLNDHPRTIEFDSGSYLKANNALVLPIL